MVSQLNDACNQAEKAKKLPGETAAAYLKTLKQHLSKLMAHRNSLETATSKAEISAVLAGADKLVVSVRVDLKGWRMLYAVHYPAPNSSKTGKSKMLNESKATSAAAKASAASKAAGKATSIGMAKRTCS